MHSLKDKSDREMTGRLALCTAVYPGVEPWLPDLCASIAGQTDPAFDLFVILDGVPEATWLSRGGAGLSASLLHAPAGATTADVRNLLLTGAAAAHDGLVLVDSDDILLPERVAAARAGLRGADVVGCAMELVDQAGQPLGLVFGHGSPATDRHIIESNRFGMGNGAWRSQALLSCLPIPSRCRAADWFVATRALLQGHSLRFDPVPLMRYRQHSNNLAGVLPPFSPERLLRGALLAREHYDLVLALDEARPGRPLHERLQAASRQVDRFLRKARSEPEWLTRYGHELDRRGPLDSWWAFLDAPTEDE